LLSSNNVCTLIAPKIFYQVSYISFIDEEWKDIEVDNIHPNLVYQISNQGRIRERKTDESDWSLLRFYVSNTFYYCALRMNATGKKKRSFRSVHRLVALHFIVPQSEKHICVVHKNYNMLDNRVENLMWITREELAVHHKNNPRVQRASSKTGSKITNSKLTETQVKRLKLKLKRGNNAMYKIAKEFGISHTQLNRIRDGINWAHVKV
jgi:hypothetical protein